MPIFVVVPHQSEERTLLLVLGMGRSGTSALANTLALCGAHLPDHLFPAHESNAKGHFEPLEALAINLEFLASFGSDWDDPTFRVQDEVEHAQGEAFVGRITEFLVRYSDRSPLVVKEPRITMLTGYWFDAASRSGWDVKIVVAVRHPDEVGASLARRQKMPVALADALWTKYNFLAEHDSRDLPRVFVRYDRLLAEPRKQIERVARALGVDLAYDEADGEAREFLESALRHHDSGDDLPADPVMAAVFDELDHLCADNDADLDKLDRLRERFVSEERAQRGSSPSGSRP